tara:strand:- start:7424 stop:9307 length:1884 start_codon:yes stop_codon:yes gene_type:complete
MIKNFYKILDLVSNMGTRYVTFRILYTIKTKVGWKKIAFPTNLDLKKHISLEDWKKNLPPFFFYGKEINGLEKKPTEDLKNNFENIKKGIYLFFNKSKIDLGLDYDWITNPITKYKYDINKHWSEIKDLSPDAGDIKYVWEKSRFTFLIDIIRYDYHYNDDQSKFIFNQIEDFIDKNPINQGPNYICSQEISLRVLNWTFALYYYKDSGKLTEELFHKIMHSIYWQIHHVYKNINFSRISVRNNHAITETLMLFLSGKLFPFFPNIKLWSKKGKIWFEKEIEYQIYSDGTHLQYSMNYHRVVIQLLTLGIKLSEINKDLFNKKVYNKAKKSLYFLQNCINHENGNLPNTGANDGALFFKFSDNDYRDYRSQLDDLRFVLFGNTSYNSNSVFWYGASNVTYNEPSNSVFRLFDSGGYSIINDSNNVKTFVKCSSYNNRPSQADNNHVDIWVNGINYFRDNGSYLYNTNKDYVSYFNGALGHNTCTVNNTDQMIKGPRFIWFNWIKKSKIENLEFDDRFEINSSFEGFKKLGESIVHNRRVIKYKNKLFWTIIDSFENTNSLKKQIYWHTDYKLLENIDISITDLKKNKLSKQIKHGKYSTNYGEYEESPYYYSESKNGFITTIKIKEN